MKEKKSFFQENWLLILVLLYIILPVDLIPDRTPIVGTLDDGALLLLNIILEYRKWKLNNEGRVEPVKGKSEVKEGEIVE
ncbi:MAG TPA: YkvA family protein [Candidatus Dojkabacteria bacterium]|nr:YkvA family protein [Candidatus Dojkabacteria bacterium]